MSFPSTITCIDAKSNGSQFGQNVEEYAAAASIVSVKTGSLSNTVFNPIISYLGSSHPSLMHSEVKEVVR